MIVLAAAAAANGGTIDAALARAVEARGSVDLVLRSTPSSTCGAAGASAACSRGSDGALSIKPILSVDAEGIRPIERARTQKRAFERMVDFADELVADREDGVLRAAHPGAGEGRAARRPRAARSSATTRSSISEIGPAIGVHTGPGLLGIGGSRRACWNEV